MSWPLLAVFQNGHIFKLVDHVISQIQHNCLISGGIAHIQVCKTLDVPRIGHFELAIIGHVFQSLHFWERAGIGWESVGIGWERAGICCERATMS